MSREELKNYIQEQYPAYRISDSFDFTELHVPKDELLKVLTQLKNEKESLFDFLFCETAIDRNPAFELVYHLHSTRHRHDLVVKTVLEDRDNPVADSVSPLWSAAELYEDEIYDLFGIYFNGHPNLRRIMLTDEWVGYPLRKDYKDEYTLSR